jgi:ABC-2 type transport system permease protein
MTSVAYQRRRRQARAPKALRLRQRRGTIALAGRETRRVLSLWTQTILPPVITAALFLAVFGGALGGRIRHIAGLPYISFILPGLLVMTVAGQSFGNAATSLFQAKNEGYIEDVLTSPLRPRQIVLSYLSGGLLRGLLAAAVVAAGSIPFAREGAQPILAALALVLAGLLFSSLGVITALWAETFDQHAFVANIVIAPLALLGGVFYSARTLAAPWGALTRLDPLYYLVDATRSGLTGVHTSPVWVSLALLATVAVVALGTATTLLARGWRLKA